MTAMRAVLALLILGVDPARVNADRPYGIRAVIRAGGATLFETREPTPVLTQGLEDLGLGGRWPGGRAQAAADMRFFERGRAA
jgi:hypothetical protein